MLMAINVMKMTVVMLIVLMSIMEKGDDGPDNDNHHNYVTIRVGIYLFLLLCLSLNSHVSNDTKLNANIDRFVTELND